MNKAVKRIIIGTSVTAAGAAALVAEAYLFTKKMMRIALDRDIPKNPGKSISRISGSLPDAEIMEKIKTAASELKEKITKTVEISSYDGEKLVGHFYENKSPKRIIIAMHGWRSSWANDFGSISEFWHNNNCSVLYAEQRGQNNSGGDFIGFGLIERYDCLEWAKWVNEITGKKLPIYLAGISMGASTVLMASGLKLPENVAGIMSDCGFTSPQSIWKHVVENNLNLSYGMISGVANDICKKKINMNANDYSTIDALTENTIPILLIHGTDDTFVPIDMTYENYKACTAPKRILVVPGAGHAMSYIVDKKSYEDEVNEFWKSCENIYQNSNN